MSENRILAAYEAFAAIYNEFNHQNDYEMWLGRALLPELERHGLNNGSVLDVGCGSGRAFAPLLSRGWQVTGCDLSPSMLELAHRAGEGEVRLLEADMRELGSIGEFDLVVSLNDPMNYLLGDDDLEKALDGMRTNLTSDGLLIFDCSSRMTFETLFSAAIRTTTYDGRTWTWRGGGQVPEHPGVFQHVIEGDDIEPITLRERFRPEAEVREAMQKAGLQCLAALGMEEADGEVILIDPPDEERQYKVVYIGAKA